MSQHFFCRLILIILLASTNLLSSMHDHNAKKSFIHSKNGNTEENKQKHKDPNKDLLLSPPSSMPSFQQQSIVLQNNAENQYPLLFDRNQQSCMTYYLLDGIQVAKLMQVDDEINFASNDCKPINFSFQIPYQVGSLTINTQGQCIFEKKIDVYSADLTGKTIDFYDAFFSNKSLTVTAQQDMTNAGTMEILGLLEVDSNNIKCKETSNITVDSANFKVKQTISNEGTVLVKNHLAAHSRVLSNAGKIEANSADIKVDRYYYNKIFSVISARNDLIINTPLSLNLLGCTHAQSLTINSAIGLNFLGMYAAKNMNFNALFSINAGLSLPKFSTFSEMFSWNNIWGFGESLFIKYVPIYGTIYAALKNMRGFYRQGKTLYDETSSLRKQKTIGASNLIALICLSKALVCSARQAYNLTQQSHSLVSHSSQTNNLPRIEYPTITVEKAKDIAQNVASSAVSHYGPSVSTDAIVDRNYGVALSVNNNTNSLSSNNSGISLYAQNNIDTSSGNNTGYLGAYNLNVKASYSYNSAGNIGISSANINAHNLVAEGSINALKDVHLKGTFTTIGADVKAKKIAIKSDWATIDSKAHLNSPDIHVHSERITQHGLITSQQVVMQGENITNNGTVQAPKIIVARSNPNNNGWFSRHDGFVNRGSMQASEQLVIDMKNISLNETSHISTPSAYFKSNGSYYNNGEINATQMAVDARLQATNGGSLNVSELHIKSRNLLLEKTSDITAKNAYFQTDCHCENKGQIKSEQCVIDSQTQVTNSGNINSSQLFQVKSQNINLEKTSDISTKNAYFQVDSDESAWSHWANTNNWQNDGKINTEQCDINSQRKVINNGEINAEQSLHVKAQNVLFQKGSNVKTKDAYYKADHNVSIDGLTQVERGSVEAGGKVTTIGKFGASNQLDINAEDIIFERKSDISAPKACLTATETIKNSGNLAAPELFAHAKYVANEGNIITDKAHIKADRYFWNRWLGSIDAKEHLTIDAFLLLNTLGHVGADSLRTNSIIDLNLLGIYQGYNISQNSLIAWNKGLLLPRFKSSNYLQELCTWRNLVKLCEMAGMQYFPQWATTWSLLKCAACCFIPHEKEASLYGRICAVSKKIQDLSEKKDLCVSDVVPVICEAKNILTIIVQTSNQAYGLASHWNNKSEEQQLSEDPTVSEITENTTVPTTSIVSTVSSFIGSQVSNSVTLFGPQLSRDSLIDVNSGLMVGINGNSQSLYNVNSGASLFANNNSINTVSGANTGFIGGGNISTNAAESYTSNGMLAGMNIAMTARNLEVAGNTYATNNVALKAHRNAVIDREIKARNISIHAQNMLIKKDASIVSQNKTSVVATETVINKGTIDGNQTVVQGREVILRDGSKVLTNGSNGAVTVKAEMILLEDGSHINANTALIDAKSIQGEKGNTITTLNGATIKTNHLDNEGTINGPALLEFNGQADQLESIGMIDQFSYKGTLENDIADKLANGHNDLLNVNNGGSVHIIAQEQDVHLKEKHNLPHGFSVVTERDIKCDQDLFSEQSLWLQAKGDVDHKSVKSKGLTGLMGKNISSKSHVTREYDGENYTESCEKNQVQGAKVILMAEQDIDYQSTLVQSGLGGTYVSFGNKLIAGDTTVEKYQKTETHKMGTCRKKKVENTTITEDTTTTSIPTTFSSEGVTYVEGNTAELHDTIFDSKGGTIINARPEQIPTFDTHIQRKETRKAKTNKIILRTETITHTEKSMEIRDTTPPLIISPDPVSLHLKCNAPSITIDAPEIECLTPKQVTDSACYEDKRYFLVWDRGTLTESQDIKMNPAYSGIINTNAQSIHIEDTKYNVPAIINATSENPLITRSLVEDLHKQQKQTTHSRPTPLAIGAIVLSLSLTMQSIGASLGAGIAAKCHIESAAGIVLMKQVTAGTLSALCNETLTGLLRHNGNIHETAKELVSKETMRNIAISIATEIATAGANQLINKVVPPLSQSTTWSSSFLNRAPQELMKGGIRTAADTARGKNPKKALKQRTKEAAANIVGATCANRIGRLYGEGKIGSGTHKILHTALGAAQGGIRSGKDGILPGALGAGVAEIVADVMSPKPPSLESMHKLESQLGRPLTQSEFTTEWNNQLSRYLNKTHSVADASKMIATGVAALAQQDVNIAFETASKAVDNNFLILALYGISAASNAYSGYKIYKTYEEKGAEEALKHLGIEIAWNAGCIVGGRLAQKAVFKIGKMVYPSAKEAVNAALNMAPSGVKSALGNLAESLISAGEKITQTKFGTTVTKTVQNIETKIVAAENKLFDKAVKKINSSPERLVEHVVPGKVLNKVEEQVVKKTAQKSAQKLVLPAPEKVLQLPAPAASEVVKEASGKIKSFPAFETVEKHIFSEKHKIGGIMDLGPTEEAINEKLIEVIKKADIKNLLQEGPNNIVTTINGKEVIIRAFIKNDNVLLSYNAFIGPSNRKVDNKIYL